MHETIQVLSPPFPNLSKPEKSNLVRFAAARSPMRRLYDPEASPEPERPGRLALRSIAARHNWHPARRACAPEGMLVSGNLGIRELIDLQFLNS